MSGYGVLSSAAAVTTIPNIQLISKTGAAAKRGPRPLSIAKMIEAAPGRPRSLEPARRGTVESGRCIPLANRLVRRQAPSWYQVRAMIPWLTGRSPLAPALDSQPANQSNATRYTLYVSMKDRVQAAA
jgi:hypothetical protein